MSDFREGCYKSKNGKIIPSKKGNKGDDIWKEKKLLFIFGNEAVPFHCF